MRPVLMFDFDGVIADSLDVFFEEFTSTCAEMGFTKLNSKEAFLQLFETNMIEGLVRAGFSRWRFWRLARKFKPRLFAASQRIRPFLGMPILLNTLTTRFPVYIITSNVSEAIEQFLHTQGIGGIRDVLGADKETSKVKKIKRVLRNHRGATPFYIGDTKGDMLEAHAAGVRTVAVTWGWHNERLLSEGQPDYIVRSIADLKGLFLGDL